MRISFFALVLLFFIAGCQVSSPFKTGEGLFQLFEEPEGRGAFYSNKKGVFAENGMVASAHVQASKVGTAILKSGGNSADAAIATFFTLAVVHPFAGNLGGGGFAIIRESDGKNHALDFREKAPLKADRDMYLDQNSDVIKGLSTLGHLASGVPGSVAGMVKMHEKLGSMAWKKLLQPAVNLAENGVVLTSGQARGMNNTKDLFQEINGLNTP